ncbi:protein MTSS 1 [Etheostoma spectabile]|uniref:protein MTSS 1 n=1 Tax=Etheostoma spectabile TaxID=54343 RepID=UPI0013AEB944|nr:protein MTSS 1 [Etheostoma spectabile]
MCSSLNSVNSSDSRSSGSHCHSPTSHFRYRASSSSSSSVLPQQTPARLSSISSHDSGFISQDAFQSKSPSPMPPESSQSCVSLYPRSLPLPPFLTLSQRAPLWATTGEHHT